MRPVGFLPVVLRTYYTMEANENIDGRRETREDNANSVGWLVDLLLGQSSTSSSRYSLLLLPTRNVAVEYVSQM